MSKIINIPLAENIIDFTADYIAAIKGRTALVSGGKRPFLFLKKKLAEKNGKAFYPPVFYTNDDFIGKIIFDGSDLVRIPDIEAAYMLYETVKEETPELLKEEKSFAAFLPWALEILSFIEQLDLENVPEERLKNVKANADIGYDVPSNINDLLKNIFIIRKRFHENLEKLSRTTKGHLFLKAAALRECSISGEFDEIILLAPFYLHKTELEIFKKIYDKGNLTILIHGDPEEYETLTNIYSYFSKVMPPKKKTENKTVFSVYSAFDDQSQAALLGNLLGEIKPSEFEKSIVVVPQSGLLSPVISEVSVITDKYNISTGYPAHKTALFTLIQSIMDAQLSRKGKFYYSKDIMKVMTNPLIKNMRFFGEPAVSRIVAHKIENALDASSKTSLSGIMFFELSDILKEESLLEEINLTIKKAGTSLTNEKLKQIIKEIFELLFDRWEKAETLSGFSDTLLFFIDKTAEIGSMQSYPLNVEAAELLISMCDELKYGEVSNFKFKQEDIINIVSGLIKDKKIALPGSPLKGIQILGLLESRNLTFDNVFIIGMTDSAIPALRRDFPLVPKDIMNVLGIGMVKKEFEIQSYHFNRLIAGAKKVYLIYPENEKEEKSRFIEKIIWEKQSESGNMNAVKISTFNPAKISIENNIKRKYTKTAEMSKYLKKMKYSYSKIDTYLRCRLQFYFQYILRLDEGIDLSGELSNSDMGIFIHDFLKRIFPEGFKSSQLRKEEFKEKYLKELNESFNAAFDLKFREDAFLIWEVLRFRMERFLEAENERDFDSVYKSEKKYLTQIVSDSGTYSVECIIDRIDKTGNGYAIFDYKTGRVGTPIVSRKFDDILALGYSRENIKRAVKSLQLPLYKYIFEKETGKQVDFCGLYDIKKAEIAGFSDNSETYNKCIEAVKSILDEINTSEYFEFDEKDSENCENCKYFYICRQATV